MPTRRDKTTGLPLPSPVVPPGTVCFKMDIPNALEYRTALKGVLSDLGRAWTWTQTVGQDNNNAHEAAALWRKAVANSTFDDDCEGEMSCDDVADCIETSPDVINNIQTIVNQISVPGTLATPGQPMTAAQSAAPLNPMDDCDWDILWAQTVKFVTYATTAGSDLLNKIESYSNSLEGAQFIELVPILGSIVDEVQIDKALQLFDWVAETAGEFYAAANNEPAREQLACDIFCAAKPDCIISIDLVWDVLNERLGGVLSPGDIDTFPEFVDALLTIIGNEDIALDLWLVSLTGFAKFLGYFGVRGLDETLRLVLLLAADEPSNDWETLCEECNEPSETRTPVINSQWDAPNIAGTLEGPDENGFYTVTATSRGTDFAYVVADAEFRRFVLTDVTFSFRPQCEVLYDNPDMLYIGCPGAQQYSGQIVTEYWATWTTGQGAQTMQFKMVAP